MRIRTIWKLRPWVGTGKSDTLSLMRARSNVATSRHLTVHGGGQMLRMRNISRPKGLPSVGEDTKCVDVDAFCCRGGKSCACA